MTTETAVLILLWLICAPIAYGATLGYFQRKYQIIAEETYWSDVWMAAVMAVMGPMGLFVAYVCSGRFERGFMWRRR